MVKPLAFSALPLPGLRKTFNPLTGTAMAGLRYRNRWLHQAERWRRASVRKAAARMGVHRTTAFRWRHRFLVVARETKDQHLGGVVEADGPTSPLLQRPTPA